ncbi:helix-turn-helix transcriptional regulator [Undibacterium aquatile]|uniref:HTH luxR-type domain-containing protein n=1 Tax=Undibacterium aquatile TaxID=1537398 RepID=A0ABR6XB83_9BURK|nr:helix-turn-helix transcriptional regulator [Undibacterium aquatile]MBC3810086.1 hypothetical protein [Undibacterium aquatile]
MEEKLDSIIGKIYDVALDQQAWSMLLADISETIGAVAGFYAGLDTRNGRGAFWYTHNHVPDIATLYNQQYLPHDPTLAHVIQSPGKAFTCADYISDEIAKEHPFYTNFLTPIGIRYVLSGVVSMRGSTVSFFGFQRTPNHPPFGSQETAIMQRLIPHLQKADELATKMSEISETKRLAMAFLDRIDYGVVFVDGTGLIRMTNQRAERLLQIGDVICARFGRLQMKSSKEDQTLRERIFSAISACDPQGGAVVTSDAAEDVQVRVVVLPIGRDEQKRLDDQEARAVVVITESERKSALAPQFLQDQYGLTAAEIRVAIGLASGRSFEELCEVLFVSLPTIKTHARHIFQKMDIHRQAELVRLVYGLPALA